ncbi:MAG: F0F1 ATP synthase subunit gamma [Patescibacteria group bacterium]
MSRKKELQEEYISLISLRNLVQTYQEIAAMRMQKAKNSVLSSRDYIEELELVYNKVRHAHSSEIPNDDADYNHIIILLSSNTMLYGGLISKIHAEFLSFVSENLNADLLLIGHVGEKLVYTSQLMGRRVYTMDLPDHVIDTEDLAKIVSKISTYEKITVFHGKYKSIMSQVVVTSNIGILESLKKEYTQEGAIRVQYIFEPSLKEVLKYFEDQLVTAIMEQVVNESNLSKFAARMVSLDSSVVNISSRINNVKFSVQRVKHMEFNKQQVNSLSGIKLWGAN